MKPAGTTTGTVLPPGTRKLDPRKLPLAYKPEDRAKQLEDENRSLRIKLKSIESQIAKNEAEATAKLNKLKQEMTESTHNSETGSEKFEKQLKEVGERLTAANKEREWVLEQLDQQKGKNDQLAGVISERKREAKKLQSELQSRKKVAEKNGQIEKEIEMLQQELKAVNEKMGSLATDSNSLIAGNSLKKTAESLEETLRKRAEQEAALEKKLVQLRSRTVVPPIVEREAKEEDEFFDAKGEDDAPVAKNDEGKKGVGENPIEEARNMNKEWKEKCESMVKQLFEAKVGWADQNNVIRTDLEKIQKMAGTTKESYEKLMGEYIWIKGEYGRCMDSLKKYRSKAAKSTK